jgi:hypothetical protein
MDVTTRPWAACECVGWGWVHGDVLRDAGLVASVECTPVREARIPCTQCMHAAMVFKQPGELLSSSF